MTDQTHIALSIIKDLQEQVLDSYSPGMRLIVERIRTGGELPLFIDVVPDKVAAEHRSNQPHDLWLSQSELERVQSITNQTIYPNHVKI